MTKSNSIASFGDTYHFIGIQAPDYVKDKTKQRLARSHAVKQALQKKRKLQQDCGDHFRITVDTDKPRRTPSKRTHTTNVPALLFSPCAGSLDPFQTLPVDQSRLQALLGNCIARQAPEPVFSVAEELAFQSFHSVFKSGLNDPALVNAAMLSMVFAATEGIMDQECLGYQGQAISYIREKVSSPVEATSESTIGAILLLAGVEARLGMKSEVQLHMAAVQLLLKISQTNGVYLNGGIKRAIFWQDLNSSVMTGSNRIVDHTTFIELQWTRDSVSRSFFCLPSGFQRRSYLLTKEFIGVLEDLHALQHIRNAPNFTNSGEMSMARINNLTASIQSRLVSMPTVSPFLKCAHLAAYTCSVMLCCHVWCALVIPCHVSSKLLRELQETDDDSIWNDHEYHDLLLWLLYIGGAFAPRGMLRAEYISLLRWNYNARFGQSYKSWPELLQVFKQFIWSDKAFMPQVKSLWEEIFSERLGQ